MADAALVQFRSLAANTAKTAVLLEAIRESFAIISPWARATSTNPAAQEVIHSLRGEARRFFDSVAQSWQNAQAGYSFAKKATELCGNLLKTEISHKEIQASILKMRDMAQKAHEDTTKTVEMFRSNRRGLHRVVATIPAIEESMYDDQTKQQTGRENAERKANAWKNTVDRLLPIGNKRRKKPRRQEVSTVKGKGQDRGKEANSSHDREDEDGDNATPNALYIAGALVSLPVTLPFLIVAKKKQASLEAQAREIDRKVVAIRTEMRKFKDVTAKLGDLEENMNTMADYWLAMDSMLEDIHDRVNELRVNDISLKIEIKGLTLDWNQVGLEYFEYKKQLATLKDSSPQILAMIEGKRDTHSKPVAFVSPTNPTGGRTKPVRHPESPV